MERSIYHAIADDIRESIGDGTYRPGDQLPSERDLIEMYGVSRQPVGTALMLLKHEGLIDRRHGAGTFVRERRPIQRMASKRLSRATWEAGQSPGASDVGTQRADVRNLSVTREPAPAWVAEILEIKAAEPVVVRSRTHYVDDEPVRIGTSYWPEDVVAGTPFEEPGVVHGVGAAVLEAAGKHFHISRWIERIQARMPMPDEAKALALDSDSGIAVFHIVQLCRHNNLTPARIISVDDMVLRADRYELVYDIPAT